jgi:hypothetical protein
MAHREYGEFTSATGTLERHDGLTYRQPHDAQVMEVLMGQVPPGVFGATLRPGPNARLLIPDVESLRSVNLTLADLLALNGRWLLPDVRAEVCPALRARLRDYVVCEVMDLSVTLETL